MTILPNTRAYGIICDSVNAVVRGYAAALGTRHIFNVSNLTHWKQLMAWFRNDSRFDSYITLALVLTDKAGPFLYEPHRRYHPVLVAVPLTEWALHYEYDLVLQPHELGWGVDKKKWSGIAENRRASSKPSFHMLSSNARIESELRALGYAVHSGDSYYLSDVALEPAIVSVPTRMYEAAASGMPVISVRENAGWTSVLGVYEDTFLDEPIADIVKEVEESDYLYAGMIATDMAPGLDDFAFHIRTLLNGFEKQLSIDNFA